jgi:uncharacterized protein (DUF1810 family)
MDTEINLQRFLNAQEKSFDLALSEIQSSKKRTHWMWYIFPQIRGLGNSEASKYYAINDMKEADAFLSHPVLGGRLITICKSLLDQPINNANTIFGSPDDIKLKSSMTLFALLPNASPLFQSVLDKFFKGMMDSRTLGILSNP